MLKDTKPPWFNKQAVGKENLQEGVREKAWSCVAKGKTRSGRFTWSGKQALPSVILPNKQRRAKFLKKLDERKEKAGRKRKKKRRRTLISSRATQEGKTKRVTSSKTSKIGREKEKSRDSTLLRRRKIIRRRYEKQNKKYRKKGI